MNTTPRTPNTNTAFISKVEELSEGIVSWKGLGPPQNWDIVAYNDNSSKILEFRVEHIEKRLEKLEKLENLDKSPSLRDKMTWYNNKFSLIYNEAVSYANAIKVPTIIFCGGLVAGYIIKLYIM